MNLSCLFDPAACVDQAVTSWLAWYPFGIEGVKATVWMIVGAALGRIGVASVIGLALALKIAGKKEADLYPHEDPTPVRAPKPKKTRRLF